jgi:hypothetical protein
MNMGTLKERFEKIRNSPEYKSRIQKMNDKKHPNCIDKHGHYFKTCGTCFTMVCRRCGYRTLDFWGSMTTTYGDFSGTTAPYDRYCKTCEVLLQRGYEGWKCYEDYEANRIQNKDFICQSCQGKGYYYWMNDKTQKTICPLCEGTGLFPSPYRKKQMKKLKTI